MYTTLNHTATQTSKTAFIWFVPIYCLMIAGAYILSSTFLPAVIESNKVFGYAFSKEAIFNQTLFTHLLICIVFIAVIHLISRVKNTSISNGNLLLAILLVLSAFCFIIGINIPLLHTTKFWIIKEDLSLIQVLENLKLKGEVQLYWLMFLFTFILPVLKLVAMAFDIFISKADGRKNILLSLITKWAMLDILVVGIVVSTMKSGSGFAEMTTGYGLTFFITSVILSLVISTSLSYTKNN